MSDIAKQLRELADNTLDAGYPYYGAPQIVRKGAAEIKRLQAERDALRVLLARMVDLAEFWISRNRSPQMSEQDWKTWHACGYGSNAMRDAKTALREGGE